MYNWRKNVLLMIIYGNIEKTMQRNRFSVFEYINIFES